MNVWTDARNLFENFDSFHSFQARATTTTGYIFYKNYSEKRTKLFPKSLIYVQNMQKENYKINQSAKPKTYTHSMSDGYSWM